MKKIMKLLPLILYPYAYLLLFVFAMIDLPDELMILSDLWPILVLIYHIYVIVFVVYNVVSNVRKETNAYELAKTNLLIKGLQIPAYIINFLLGMSGMAFLVVGGIGLIMMMIIVDLISIGLTGIHSIACSIRMRKEGMLSNAAFVFMGIGCFVYCIDVIIAIVYFVRTKKGR